MFVVKPRFQLSRATGLVILLALFCSGASIASATRVLRVKWDAPAVSSPDGSTWGTAFPRLEQALAAASTLVPTPTDPIEIWIARGTYKPTTGTDRTAAFVIPSHVHLLGGFLGTETASTPLPAANPSNEAILSGDIGVPMATPFPALGTTDPGTLDNSFNVVRVTGEHDVILQNLTVVAGAAINHGLPEEELQAMLDPAADGPPPRSGSFRLQLLNHGFVDVPTGRAGIATLKNFVQTAYSVGVEVTGDEAFSDFTRAPTGGTWTLKVGTRSFTFNCTDSAASVQLTLGLAFLRQVTVTRNRTAFAVTDASATGAAISYRITFGDFLSSADVPTVDAGGLIPDALGRVTVTDTNGTDVHLEWFVELGTSAITQYHVKFLADRADRFVTAALDPVTLDPHLLAPASTMTKVVTNVFPPPGSTIPEEWTLTPVRVPGELARLASNSHAMGGGLYARGSGVAAIGVRFRGNLATFGGGLYNEGAYTADGLFAAGTLAMISCTFDRNRAEHEGGALFDNSSMVTLADCSLTANEAGGRGGGVQTILIPGNFLRADGSGAPSTAEKAQALVRKLRDAAFKKLYDKALEGGIEGVSNRADTVITAATTLFTAIAEIAGDTDTGRFFASAAEFTQDWLTADGLAAQLVDTLDDHFFHSRERADAIVVRQTHLLMLSRALPFEVIESEFDDNKAGVAGGAIAANGSNLSIENTYFRRNHSDVMGGAVYSAEYVVPKILSCVFLDNTANIAFSAVANTQDSWGQIVNCTFAGNAVTTAGPTAFAVGAANGADVRVANSILWNNTSPAFPNGGADLYATSVNDVNPVVLAGAGYNTFTLTGNIDLHHSIVQGLASLPPAVDRIIPGSPPWDDPNALKLIGGAVQLGYGVQIREGNSALDPRLVDGFKPGIGSPALNAGDRGEFDDGWVHTLFDTDILLNPRFLGSAVDLGAVEGNGQPTSRIYVDPAATGDGSGASWANAAISLPIALTLAHSYPSVNEIWVKSGTYKPTSDADRSVYFHVESLSVGQHLKIYGGFAGTETDPAQRLSTNAPTILSGDIGAPGVTTDNSETVLLVEDGADVTFNGFTISDAESTNTSAMVSLSRLAVFQNCRFLNNHGGTGAGAHVTANTEFDDCEFSNNSSLGEGGALFSDTSATLFRCRFLNNTATLGGGGASLRGDYGWIENSLFAGNRNTGAGHGGGGLILSTDTAVLRGSTVVDNHANQGGAGTDGGGAGVSIGASAFVTGSVIWGNRGDNPSAALSLRQTQIDGSPNFISSGVEGGSADTVINADPEFVDAANGNYHLQPYSPLVNRGDENFSATALDLDGLPRVAFGRADIGAYELQTTPRPVSATIATTITAQGFDAIYKITAASSNYDLTGTTVAWFIDRGDGLGFVALTDGGIVSGATTTQLSLTAPPASYSGYRFRARVTGSDVRFTSAELALAVHAPVLYVAANATSSAQTGADWANAFRNLQQAVAVAQFPVTIRVAEGTYSPPDTTGFLVQPGVALIGGYNAAGTTRDPALYPTIITGETGQAARTDNFDYLLTAYAQGTDFPAGNPTVIDGFTLTRARRLAVWAPSASSVALRNCRFLDNEQALYANQASVDLENCSFLDNGGTATAAIETSAATFSARNLLVARSTHGALLLNSTATTLVHATITANHHDGIVGQGAGAGIAQSGSTLMIENSVIWNNDAFDYQPDERGFLQRVATRAFPAQLNLSGGAALTLKNSTVQNLAGPSTDGNQPFEPFLDANYAPTAPSPLINRGDASFTGALTIDLAGATRTVGAAPDMGAFEFAGTPATVVELTTLPADTRVRAGLSATIFAVGGSSFAADVTWEIDRGSGFVTLINDASHTLTASGTTATISLPAASLAMNGWRYRFRLTASGYVSASVTLTVFQPVPLYVDAARPASGNGLTWGTAFRHPGEALAVATSDNEIWVRAGTYAPLAVGGADYLALKPNLVVYGGFAGTETVATARDPVANRTILNGISWINSYPYASLGATAAIDGFVFTGAPTQGVAIWNDHTSPTIRNCRFELGTGGGLSLTGSSSLIIDCFFSGRSDNAIRLSAASSPRIENGTFVSNLASAIVGDGTPLILHCAFFGNTSSHGGALSVAGGTFTVRTSTFLGNAAAQNGGAIDVSPGATLLLEQCLLTINYAVVDGGALMGLGNVSLVNCTIADNLAGRYGAGLYGGTSVVNSIVWGNRHDPNGQFRNDPGLPATYPDSSETVQIYPGSTPATVRHSIVQELGATYAHASNLAFDPLFTFAFPGDYTLGAFSPALNRGDNTALTATTDLAGAPRIAETTIDLGPYERATSGGAPLQFIALPHSTDTRVDTATELTFQHGDGSRAVQWQVDRGDGNGFVTLSSDSLHTLTNTGGVARVSIPDPTLAMNGWKYRVVDGPSGLTFPAVTLTVVAPIILYVDAARGASGDGLTWATAFKTLDDALLFANSRNEIWIKRGDYMSTGVPRSLKEGVSIYGGFAGTETDRAQANPTANLTRLINTGGNAALTGFGQNQAITRATIVSGLTLRSTTAANSLASVTLTTASPDFKQCIIEDSGGLGVAMSNSAPLFEDCIIRRSAGTAVAADSGSAPTFRRVTFQDNTSATAAGAIMVSNGQVTVEDTVFQGNAGYYGGAVGISGSGSGPSTFTRVSFMANRATVAGGGAILADAGAVEVRDALFTGNQAADNGGAISAVGASLSVTQATFYDNATTGAGGAIDCPGPQLTIANSIFWGNRAAPGTPLDAVQINGLGGVTLRASDVQDLTDAALLALGNRAVDPLFANPAAGDYSLQLRSPLIDGGAPEVVLSGETDRLGNARVFGAAPDLGAYERLTAGSSPLVLSAAPANVPVRDGHTAILTASSPTGSAGAVAWEVDTGSGFAAVTADGTHRIVNEGALSTLIIDPATLAMNGWKYRIVISAESFTSAPATLTVTAPVVLRVKSGASGATNGTTWTDAFPTLDAALAVAGDTNEVWVAAGTYVPVFTTASFGFRMKNGVELVGGFAGTETSRSQRNPTTNRTILSAEIGNPASTLDNRAVTIAFNVAGGDQPVTRATIIDGFVFTGATDTAISARNASPTIRNCRFENSPGKAIASIDGSPLVVNCVFTGGASSAINATNSGLAVVGSLFTDNTATTAPGVAAFSGSVVSIVNSTFTRNSSPGFNGAITASDSTVVVRNSILWGNTAGQIDSSIIESAQLLHLGSGTVSVTRSIIEGLNTFAAPTNLGVDPLFTNPTGNDFTLNAYSPAIDAGSLPVLSSAIADLAGNSRVSGAAVDLGAFEFSGTAGAPAYVGHLVTPGNIRVGSIAEFRLEAPSTPAQTITWQIDTGSGFGALPVDARFAVTTSGGTSILRVTVTDGSLNGAHLRASVAGTSYLSAAATLTVQSATILYVNRAATGTPDGTTWAHAFRELSAALAVATAQNEIWVASGDYSPASGSFDLRDAMIVRGGFAGTETTTAQRLSNTPATVLRGLSGLPAVTFGPFLGLAPGRSTLLEGVTIASTASEAARISTASPVLRACRFEGNSGTALAVHGGAPLIDACVFIGNRAGAIVIDSSAIPLVTASTFTTNVATGDGGAIAVSGAALVTIEDALFDGNQASHGGALQLSSGSATIRRTIFRNNLARQSGGAIRVSAGATLTLVDTLLQSNTGYGGGGAVDLVGTGSSNLAVANFLFTTIAGNHAGQPTAAGTNGASLVAGVAYSWATVTVADSLIWENSRYDTTGALINDTATQFGGTNTTPAISYSSLPGIAATNGNVPDRPLFRDPVAGDFTIDAHSPTVNRGNAADAAGISFDLTGATARTLGSAPDLGAYETARTTEPDVVFTALPDSITLRTGASATFTATITSHAASSLVWQVDTGSGFADFVAGGGQSVVVTGNTSQLNLGAVTSGMDGARYRVRLSGTAFAGAPATLHVVNVTVLYVRSDAAGGGNGLTWATAFNTVSAATTAATSLNEIWVAGGTYSSSNFQRLKSNVGIYGGFAGTETQREQRDAVANVTNLRETSGGFAFFMNFSGDAAIDATAIVDGFTLTSAGGPLVMFDFGATPIFRHCTFTGTLTYAVDMTGSGTNARFEDCVFKAMSDGVRIHGSAGAQFVRCSFTDNAGSALFAVGSGTGILDVQDSEFLRNTGSSGSAIQVTGGVTLSLVRSTVKDNNGPAVQITGNGAKVATITDTLFSTNTSTEEFGVIPSALYLDGALALARNQFTSNAATSGPAVYLTGGSGTVDRCEFRGNTSTDGALTLSSSGAVVTNSLFAGNLGTSAGAIRATGSGVTLVNCTVVDNRATTNTGGVLCISGTATIRNSLIWGNRGPTGTIEIQNLQVFSTTSLANVGLEGHSSYSIASAIDSRPLFLATVDATSAPSTTGDYRLHASSPAVDAGNNSFTATPLDLAGNARQFGGSTIDLGAYELNRTAITPATIISAYPAAVTYRDGVTDTFTIGVTGSGLTFAWEVDPGSGFVSVANGLDPSGAIYSGATTASLKISGGTTAMDGYHFRVTIGNADGPFHTSPSALLTVPVGRLYVKSDATGTGTGLTWTNAFTTIRAALASTRVTTAASYPVEIWVAAGTYYPSTTNNRSDALTFKTGVALYGGFAGTETSLAQRDWTARPTIVSGNIGSPGSFTDNSVNLFVNSFGSAVDSSAILDGFFLQDAWDNSSGSAMKLSFVGTPVIRNTTFRNNRGSDGAAVNLSTDSSTVSSPRFENCVFQSNDAISTGGAVSTTGSSATFVNCVFNGNHGDSFGGAVTTHSGSGVSGTVVFTNCTFHANTSPDGAVLFTSGALVTVRNSIAWNNTATVGGGHAITNLGNASDLTLVNVRLDQSASGTNVTVGDPLFVNAAGADGILGTADDDLRLANTYPTRFSPAIDAGNNSFVAGVTTDVRGNATTFPRITDGNGIGAAAVDLGAYETAVFVAPSTIAVTRSNPSGGEGLGDLTSAIAAVADGGTVTFDPSITSVALFQSIVITRNVTVRAPANGRVALVAGGTTRLLEIQSGNASFVGLDFMGGAAPGADGGAVLISGTGTARFYGARFLGNSAQRGGAVFAGGGTAEFVNTVFSGNSATQDGGAVYAASGNVYFRHASAGGNSATGNGGAVRVGAGTRFALENSILWANTAAGGADLSADAQATLALSDSILSGTWSGARLLVGDPLWTNRLGADATAGTSDDDFTLTAASPAIDRGNNTLVPADAADLNANANVNEPTPFDLRGTGFARTVDGRRTGVAIVDLGAYEAAQNSAPTLTAFTPLTVAELSTLTFTAVATDADTSGGSLVFSLDASAPAGASITSAGGFTWTPTEAQGPGTYIFPIIVSDGGIGGTLSQQLVTVTVTEVNTAPTLAAVSPVSVAEGAQVAVTLVAADVDLPVNRPTYSLQNAPAFASIGADGVLRLAPLEADGPAVYTFNAIVSDGTTTAQRSVSVTVTETNVAPVLAAMPAVTVAEGATLQIAVSATDANLPAQTLTFSLSGAPAGLTINTSTGVITWTPTEAQGPGTYTFSAIATDNGTPALAGSTSITVNVTEVNRAPVLAAIGARSAIEGSTLAFTATATDPDLPGQALTFSLIGAPSGASITTAGAFTWTPGETQGGAVYPFTVRVTDNGTPAFFSEETIAVSVAEGNTAPTLAAVSPVAVNEGSPLTITLAASDPDVPAQTLVFSLASAPAGMTVSPAGVITWTPTEAQGPAIYTFDAIVTDNGAPALSATRSITVTVNEVNTAPVLPAVSAQTINESEAWSLAMAATDVDLPVNVITYTLFNSPLGMTISSSGVIHYTPADDQGGQSYNVIVRATDNGTPALFTERTIALTILDTNSNPTLAALTSQSIPEGVPFTFTAVAMDPDIPAQTLTYSLTGAPAGAAIDPATGVFTWTPNESQGPGVYTFNVVVTDNGVGALTDSRPITLTVTEGNSVPVVADQTGLTANEGVLFTKTFTATDADVPAQTLTFSLTNAPSGAVITSAGVFTYTPTETQGGTTVTFTVNATDNAPTPATGSKTFVLTIADTNLPPVANNDALTVTRGSSASVNVLANDTDPDVPVDTLTVTAVTQGSHGAVTFAGGGTVTYTHNNDASATDSFTYTVSDGHGGTATGTVNVTVTLSASLITVQNTADSGPGSLREAIAALVPGVPATIDFLPALANQSIVVTTVGDSASGDSAYVIPANVAVTIDGTAATNLTLTRGGTALRFFRVATGGVLTLKRITLSNGAGFGPPGGDFNAGGGGGAGLGGAMLVEGTATLNQVTMSDCAVTGGKGGGYVGGSLGGNGGGPAGGAGGAVISANGAAGGELSGGGAGAGGPGPGLGGVAGFAGGTGALGQGGNGGAGGYGGGGGAGGGGRGGGGGAGFGGALAVVRGTVTAIDCVFGSNTATGGAGGIGAGGSDLNGTAGSARGGAIFAYNATLTLTRALFGGNFSGTLNDVYVVGNAAVATTVLESVSSSRIDFTRIAGGTLNTRAYASTKTNWTGTPTLTTIAPQSASGLINVPAFFNSFTTLTVTTASADPAILASSLISGSGSALGVRTIAIVPPPSTSGVARVRITGTDGTSTFTEEFLLTISTGAYGVPFVGNGTKVATSTGTSVLNLQATHPQNLPLTYVLVTPPAQGTITIVGSNAFYTPNPGHTALDTFQIRVFDQFGGATSLTSEGFESIIFRDPPVVGADLVLVPTGTSAKVLKSTLLANDTDPGNTAITFFSVGSTTAQGGTITTDANYVYYVPPASVSGDDTVTYTVNNGFGLFGSGTITFRQQAPASTITRTTLSLTTRSGGGVTLRLVGVPARSYTVSVSTDLVNWTVLATVTSDAQGLYSVDDPASPPDGTGRFYRALRTN